MQDKQLSGILLEHVSFFVEIKKKKKAASTRENQYIPAFNASNLLSFPSFFFFA